MRAFGEPIVQAQAHVAKACKRRCFATGPVKRVITAHAVAACHEAGTGQASLHDYAYAL